MNNAFFEILRSGINSTLQDEGRFNQYHIGIPFSGAMDKRNYLISNHLVGNKKNAASLEFAYQGPLLKLKFGKVSFAIAGNVKFNETDYKGVLNLSLPNNDGTCEGNYILQNNGKGTWNISCTNNMGAAGTLKWKKNGSVTGIGRDFNDKKVKFTVSKET